LSLCASLAGTPWLTRWKTVAERKRREKDCGGRYQDAVGSPLAFQGPVLSIPRCAFSTGADGARNCLPDRAKLRSFERPEARGAGWEAGSERRIIDALDRRVATGREATPRFHDGKQTARCSRRVRPARLGRTDLKRGPDEPGLHKLVGRRAQVRDREGPRTPPGRSGIPIGVARNLGLHLRIALERPRSAGFGSHTQPASPVQHQARQHRDEIAGRGPAGGCTKGA